MYIVNVTVLRSNWK